RPCMRTSPPPARGRILEVDERSPGSPPGRPPLRLYDRRRARRRRHEPRLRSSRDGARPPDRGQSPRAGARGGGQHRSLPPRDPPRRLTPAPAHRAAAPRRPDRRPPLLYDAFDRGRVLARDAPAPLASLVMRCLQKQPRDRPSSAREVLAELEALATPPAALAALRLRPWGGAWFRMAAAGLTFVALAVIGYFVVPRGLRATLMTLLQRPAAKLEPRRIVVAPFDNETGDSSLAMLGNMAADWITQGLMRAGVADVVDARTALLTSRVVE